MSLGSGHGISWDPRKWPVSHPVVLLMGGALGALSMPPFDLPFMLIPMMVLAVWVLDQINALRQAWGQKIKRCFVAGWFLGFGYFTAGLWWLAYAFLVEPDQFALLIPLGIFGLPAVLALFTALACVMSLFFWSAHASRILTLAAVLGCSEWLRGLVFTGLPWNSFGLALAAIPAWAQTASLVGQPGLTVLAVFCAAAPASLFDAPFKKQQAWLLRKPVMTGALLLLCAMTAGGLARLSLSPPAFVDHVRLRVLQPNIAQDAKFTPAYRDEIMRAYLSMTAQGLGPEKIGMRGVTHVIWPESAFPFLVARDALALQQIAALLAPDAVLITGAVRDDRLASPLAVRRYYNSAMVVTAKGEITATTDKVHLVPFGEYLPFADLLGRLGLRQFVPSPGIFTAAETYQFLPVPGLDKVQALICYEIIFPAAVTRADHRPSVFLNLTNDAWFGVSPGPHQHFAQARLRAIEEGVPLVRSANGGLSAVVDPYGRIIAGLRLGESGAFTSPLPKAITPPLFALGGHAVPLFLMALLMWPACREKWRTRHKAHARKPDMKKAD